MGFEPATAPSRLESVNEFKSRMEATLEEAKAALGKAKDDMARYYNRRREPAPTFKPGDRVYLDAMDISTTRPSTKLGHRRLGPFEVDRAVGSHAYRLKLPPSLRLLHPVFPIVKLTLCPPDPIPGRRPSEVPLPTLVDSQEEWEVERVLDSRVMRGQLRYLIQWRSFGRKHNSWEIAEDVHTPTLVAQFHREHPSVVRVLESLVIELGR